MAKAKLVISQAPPEKATGDNKSLPGLIVDHTDGQQPFFEAVTQTSVRKPPEGDRNGELLRVVDSPDGPFKEIVKGIEGSLHGLNATATFIRYHLPELAWEIQQSRVVWISTEESGGSPNPQAIKARFPKIDYLCPDRLISSYMQNSKTCKPRQAAAEIINKLFPDYDLKSILRMGRNMRRYKEAGRKKRS